MDSQENSGRSSSNISTEDILKALDSYGEKTKLSPSNVDRSKGEFWILFGVLLITSQQCRSNYFIHCQTCVFI